MRPDAITRGDAILEIGRDGGRVQAQHMIAFGKGIHDQLPVRRHLVRAPGIKMLIVKTDGIEIGGEWPRRQAEIRRRIAVQPNPDQPARFHARHLDEIARVLVEARERLRPRQAFQLAISAIAPRVIGADKRG